MGRATDSRHADEHSRASPDAPQGPSVLWGRSKPVVGGLAHWNPEQSFDSRTA